jgi:hypothetical protein
MSKKIVSFLSPPVPNYQTASQPTFLRSHDKFRRSIEISKVVLHRYVDFSRHRLKNLIGKGKTRLWTHVRVCLFWTIIGSLHINRVIINETSTFEHVDIWQRGARCVQLITNGDIITTWDNNTGGTREAPAR